METNTDFRKKLDTAFSRNVYSFDEYLQLVRENPGRNMRGTLEYIRDCLDYFGSEMITVNGEKIRRFNMFDAPFDEGRDPLIGQEEAQNAFYSFLESQGTMARAPKIFILHGPNGSAKSTFFRLLSRGLEAYSRTDEGAVFKFNWIFPAASIVPKGIGFGKGNSSSANTMDSYAHLDGNAIDALLPDEMKDHPLYLIPQEKREEILLDYTDGKRVPEWLLRSDLNPRNKQIFDALFMSSSTGISEVFKYVQVERYFLSRRYRRGIITSEPKMAADAHIRQLTSDHSLGSLPPALQNQELYRYYGDLVDANRGLIEFADLFKKPLEGFKYLINTLEEGFLNLEMTILQFDICFSATVNDRQLLAFTETSDFSSFEGRSEFIKMPYLLDYNQEKNIQDRFLTSRGEESEIAPHVLETVSIWAVMSRLVKPQYDDPDIGSILSELTVYEKAKLYGNNELPARYHTKTAQQVKAVLPELKFQMLSNIIYEGGIGASPRLVRSILLRAMTRYELSFVSVLSVFTEIEKLYKDKNTHEFLNYPAQEGGYHDSDAILEFARKHWEELVSSDLWSSAGLIKSEKMMERLSGYINMVIHYVKGEKIKDEVTGAYHEASEKMMAEFEEELDIKEDVHEFRSNCISRIGAYKIDFPNDNPDYLKIFSPELNRINQKNLSTRKQQLIRILELIITYHGEGTNLKDSDLKETVEQFTSAMKQKGYSTESMLEAVEYYIRKNSGS
ncbi:MAG: hypothetical protein JXR95_15435 [Deltaproteobacteria bacterium]|nr:hypothetical protein [Deltaproteobacteria bacterium]